MSLLKKNKNQDQNIGVHKVPQSSWDPKPTSRPSQSPNAAQKS